VRSRLVYDRQDLFAQYSLRTIENAQFRQVPDQKTLGWAQVFEHLTLDSHEAIVHARGHNGADAVAGVKILTDAVLAIVRQPLSCKPGQVTCRNID
jgi:hypothetical protein